MSDPAKKMLRMLGAMLLFLVAASIVYYRSLAFLPFAVGALLGVAVNALKVLQLDRAVQRSVAMETRSAGNYIRLSHLLRLLLTGLVLALSAIVPFVSLWGAAAGVFTMQIAAYAMKRSMVKEEDTKGRTAPTRVGGD